MSTSYNQSSQLSENQAKATTRVLVVDDDAETTDLLKIILESNSFEVVATNTGEEGVQLARTNQPDVIIVDLLMPEMDGLTVCQAIREFSNIPIVVLSAYDRPGTAEQALQFGADDYLLKPMNNNLLIASIHRLARRARAEQQGTRLSNNGRSTH